MQTCNPKQTIDLSITDDLNLVEIEGREAVSDFVNDMNRRVQHAEQAGRPLTHRKRVRVMRGRNKPCPCGSGKKQKQCCFKAQ